jgi:hypothetical protein
MPPKGWKKKNQKRKADLISEHEEADTASIVETSENATADATVSDIPPPLQITPETDMSAVGHVVQPDTAPAVTTTEPVGDTPPKESILTDPSKQDEPSRSNPVEIGPEPLSTHPAAANTAASGVSPNNNVYDSIRYCIISNDGNHDHLIKLIGLKSLFAKMLPKMPKEYIVRLVMDKRHKSLAILSDDPAVKGGDDEIIAAICYRPYSDMRFAEVAFCAVAMSQQVKVREHAYEFISCTFVSIFYSYNNILSFIGLWDQTHESTENECRQRRLGISHHICRQLCDWIL